MKLKKLENLFKIGYDANVVALLDITKVSGKVIIAEPKITAILNLMERKGLLQEGLITLEGEKLLTFMQEEDGELIKDTKQTKDDLYYNFIVHFPASDGFNWKGKIFPKTRSIRKNSEKAKELYLKAILTVTPEKLLNAISAECVAKMTESYKTGVNKMQFFVNTETYLRNRGWEAWMDEEVDSTLYENSQKRIKKGSESSNETFI